MTVDETAIKAMRAKLIEILDAEDIEVTDRQADLIVDYFASRESARSAEPVAWRHKKRGSLYEIVGEAQIQTSRPLEDYEVVVIYRSLNTPDIDDPKSPMKGELWARPKAEFHDGRFELAHPTPEASDV